MLSSIFSPARPPAAPAFPRGMIPMKVRAPSDAPIGEFTPPAAKRRTAIYDMHHSVHCSIIGTCLSSAELRRLMVKLGIAGSETAGDHDLHKQGVTLAGRAQGGGKLIQKALDRRHEAARAAAVPLHLDDAAHLASRQGGGIGAVAAVHAHASAPGDETDDLVARHRRAAP